jgi:hypothetical protein
MVTRHGLFPIHSSVITLSSLLLASMLGMKLGEEGDDTGSPLLTSAFTGFLSPALPTCRASVNRLFGDDLTTLHCQHMGHIVCEA